MRLAAAFFLILPQLAFALEKGKRYDFLCDDGQDIINAELVREDSERYFVRLSAALADIRIEKRFVRQTREHLQNAPENLQRWRAFILPGAQFATGRLAEFARVAPIIVAGVGRRIFYQIEMVGRADYSRLAKDSASLNIARLAAGAEYPLPVVFWQLSVTAGAGGGVAQIFGGVDSFRVSSAIPFALAWLVLKRKISAAWSLVLQPEFSALFDNRSAYFLAAFHAGVSYGF